MEQNTSLATATPRSRCTLWSPEEEVEPKMLPYIFAEKKGIHIIDLNKTTEACRKLQLLETNCPQR
jgi:small subunit ribosomal protein S2